MSARTDGATPAAPPRRPRRSPSPSTASAPVPQGDEPARGLQRGRRRRPVLLLPPGPLVAAVCRQCLVDVKGQPKPVPSCYTPVADKMEVTTTRRARSTCAGRCWSSPSSTTPSTARSATRRASACCRSTTSTGTPSTPATTASRSTRTRSSTSARTIVLDQERCILCTRCIRVCDEVAKQPQLEMAHRGDHEVLTTAPGHQLDNPYSLNTVDVCPVGALTSKDFRFAMRAGSCTRRRRSARAAPRAATSRCTTRATRSIAWSRATTRPSTSTGCATRAASPTSPFTRSAWRCPGLGRLPVEWTARSTTPARLLRAALDGGPAESAWCSTPSRPTRISTRWPGWPSRASARQGLPGRPDHGWCDDILVSADKNPNTAGAKAIGGAGCDAARSRQRPRRRARHHAARGRRRRGLAPPTRRGACRSTGSRRWWWSAAPRPVADAAQVVLPLAAWAEVDGTFTNNWGWCSASGRPAAGGDSLPGWEILSHLARAS